MTDGRGTRAISVGFGGEIQIWICRDGTWSHDDAGPGNMTFFLINYFTYETDGIQQELQILVRFGLLLCQKMGSSLLVLVKMVTSKSGT